MRLNGKYDLLPFSQIDADQSKVRKPGRGRSREEGQSNTYDVWKAFAIVTMMVDHFGLFGFSRSINLRLVGRFSAPVFYFLVGIVPSKRVSPKHAFWCGFLFLVNLVYDLIIPKSNSLMAILLCKLFLLMVDVASIPWVAMIPVQACLILSNHIVQPHLEYGNLCLLHAIGGELVRTRHRWRWIWVPVTCGFHFYRSQVFYNYRRLTSDWWLGVVSFIMITFSFLTFTQTFYGPYKDPVRKAANSVLLWASKYALEIYVLHLIAYKFHLVHTREWQHGYR